MTAVHVMYIGLVLVAVYFALRLFYRIRPGVQKLRTAIMESIKLFEDFEKQPRPDILPVMDRRTKKAQDEAAVAVKALKEHMRSPLWFFRYQSLSAHLRRLEESTRELRGATKREFDQFKILAASPFEKPH